MKHIGIVGCSAPGAALCHQTICTEAAAMLGAPEGTIAWRVHEARRKLKEYMIKRGFDPEEMG